MKSVNFKKYVGIWMGGMALKAISSSESYKLVENYKYSSPFRLPRLNTEEFGNTFTYHKNKKNDNGKDYAQKISDEIYDITGVELLPLSCEVGANVTKIKFKPMNSIRKGFNLKKEIKYVVDNENIRFQDDGAKLIVEIPKKGETVYFGDFMHDLDYQIQNKKTVIPIGQGTDGKNVYADLCEMPHLLVAGTTGSGKSVFLNGVITSLLMKNTPYDLQLYLIDPKMVEFSRFSPLKYVHYESDINKAITLLSSLCDEMDRRYDVISKAGCRDIDDYNKLNPNKKMPKMVLVIDEMADMICNKSCGKKVENNIVRLAQKARASGIHMILATQRPTTNVVTGLIKANIPCRVALSVTSRVDSMVILDRIGAENLLGNGDMLFLDGKNNKEAKRLQAGFISKDEINNVVVPLVLENQGGNDELKNQVFM